MPQRKKKLIERKRHLSAIEEIFGIPEDRNGLYCISPYYADKNGKLLCKLGYTDAGFGNRLSHYHTSHPMGVFILAVIDLTHLTDQLRSHYERQMMKHFKEHRFNTTTRITGKSEWFYFPNQSVIFQGMQDIAKTIPGAVYYEAGRVTKSDCMLRFTDIKAAQEQYSVSVARDDLQRIEQARLKKVERTKANAKRKREQTLASKKKKKEPEISPQQLLKQQRAQERAQRLLKRQQEEERKRKRLRRLQRMLS